MIIRIFHFTACWTTPPPGSRSILHPIFWGRLTYQEIKDYSDRLAEGVRRLGVQPGERVALLLPNWPQFIIAYYGLLKAGAVVVSLNPLCSLRELGYQLNHAGVNLAITIPLFLENLATLRQHTDVKTVVYSRLADFMPLPLNLVQGFRENKLIRDVNGTRDPTYMDFRSLIQEPAGAAFVPEQVDPDQMAVMIYSGGTTGVAKGIMLSHFNCRGQRPPDARLGKSEATDRLLAVLPLFHGYGMSVNMNTALLAGGEIVLVPRFNAKR